MNLRSRLTPRSLPASRNPFRVLAAHRNFRIFWIGQTLSLVGSWMQTMAMGWLTLELSDSKFWLGVVSAAGAWPIVLFSMHAGAFVERSDRMRIVRITQGVLLLQAAALWGLTWTGQINVTLLVVLALIQGACSAVEIPARQSLIIQLVGRDDLQPAIALNSSGFNLARVVGPMVGGPIINLFGIAWCFAINAVSFVAVLWGLYRIRLPITASAQSHGSIAEAVMRSTNGALEGLRHLLQPGPVRQLFAIVTVGALFGAPFITMMPAVARDQLGADATGYARLLEALGVGGLVGALMIAGPATHWRRGRVLQLCAVAFPLLVIAFALVTNLLAAYIVLFGVGISMIALNALTNGTLQLLVSDAYRSRLMAFYSLVFVGLSQAVGSFAIGAVASLFDTRTAIIAFSVVTLLCSGWIFSRSRQLATL